MVEIQAEILHPPRSSRLFAFLGGGHVNAASVAGELELLAERLSRLRPVSRLNPHAFFEDRSELTRDVRAIAQWLRTGRKPTD